jgi:hypothetical protein
MRQILGKVATLPLPALENQAPQFSELRNNLTLVALLL